MVTPGFVPVLITYFVLGFYFVPSETVNVNAEHAEITIMKISLCN